MNVFSGTGGSHEQNRSRQARILTGMLVFLTTLTVFLPDLRNGFVNWDDNLYVYDNPYIRQPFANVFAWALSSFYAGNWHPLTWISHTQDYSLWGLNPLGHHLTSNIIHALNAMIVVFLSMRVLEICRDKENREGSFLSYRGERELLIAGAITGLLFGIHPLRVESVAWVSERKDLLCALFFLLSILFYLSYKTDRTYKAYFLSLGLYVLSLMSKPMAVTLPVIILIFDWYPFQNIRSLKTFGRAITEKIPFFALSIISFVLTFRAAAGGRHIVPFSASALPTRIMISADAVLSYLGKILLPVGLKPFYTYPVDAAVLSLKFLIPVLTLTAVMAISVLLAIRQRKLWIAALGYYLVTLLPVLGIVRVGMQSMADRYTYLPALAPFFVFGVAAARGYQKLETVDIPGMKQKTLGAALALGLFAVLSFITVAQIRIWENSIALWSYVMEHTPERLPFVFSNRGTAYNDIGEYDLAILDFDAALKEKPDYVLALYNRGLAYTNKGNQERAIEDFTKAIKLKPNYTQAYLERADSLMKSGDAASAAADYRKACELGSDAGCRELKLRGDR